jgi:heme exporter protein A
MTLQSRQLSACRADRCLFDGLDLTVRPGEALKVSGPNGSGKSTLLRLLCGLTEPASGEVLWQGQPIRSARERLHQALCHVGHGNGLKDELTASENLRFSAWVSGRACTDAQARAALAQVGLADRAQAVCARLSQGQRRRVALARLALSPAPTLLILDEPFNALDQTATHQVQRLLREQLARGATLVYTQHQRGHLDVPQHQELHLAGVLAARASTSSLDPAWIGSFREGRP